MSSNALEPGLILQNRQRRVPVDLVFLRDFASRALTAVIELAPQGGDVLGQLEEIAISLISDRAMAKFHVQFMGIAGPTDVLTFEHGEILISAETAAVFAAEYNLTPLQEIALYILHGLLHLRGYDDRTPSDHKEMHRVQNAIFARIS